MKKLKVKKTDEKNYEESKGSDPHSAIPCRSTATIFSLLPDNWDMILPYLGSTDFHSLTQTCTELNKRLQEHKSAKLFPLVSSLLLKYVPPSKTLLLRQVNRETKKNIDEELAQVSLDLTSRFITNYWQSREIRLNNVEKLVQKLNRKYNFWHVNDVNRFIASFNLDEDLEGGHRRKVISNPFLLRKVSFSHYIPFAYMALGLNPLEFPPQPIPPWEKLIDFGHHLWSLTFDTLDPEVNNVELHLLKLMTLLYSMPNLKILKTCGLFEKCKIMESPMLRQGAYPQLPSLQHLEFGSTSYSPDDLTISHVFLKRYGGQLATLVCSGPLLLDSNQNFWRQDNLSSHFQNLCRLQVGPIVGRTSLLKLAQINCPLKNLQIGHLVLNAKEPKLKISDFLTIIDHFSNTLEELGVFLGVDYLNLEIDCDDQMNPEQNRKLLNLKKFATDFRYVRGGWLWLVILAKFPNLMELTMRSYIEPFYNERREFEKGFNLLPTLKIIVARWGVQDEKLVIKRGDALKPYNIQLINCKAMNSS